MIESLQLLRQTFDGYGGFRSDEERMAVRRYHDHLNHGPSDSIWGRCAICGLTWEGQRKALDLLGKGVIR